MKWSEQLTFRPAVTSDYLLLTELRIIFLSEFWGKPDRSVEADLRNYLNEYFLAALENGSLLAFLAFDLSAPVSVGAMLIRTQPGNFKNPSGRMGYVLNMFTVPEYRRRGLSSSILKLLIARAKELNVPMLELFATKEGEDLYFKHGFNVFPEPSLRLYL